MKCENMVCSSTDVFLLFAEVQDLNGRRFVYFGAEMETSEEFPVVAEFTKDNEPIFHKDSDFEIFLDPPGGGRWYKELEMNANNAVWNLALDRPYSCGGGEYSGRIAKPSEPRHWAPRRQRTFTYREPGRWVAVVAYSAADALDRLEDVADAFSPRVGVAWRVNFSRVERKGAINWTWTPQLAWEGGRYVGKVNMHIPDAWGEVCFVDTFVFTAVRLTRGGKGG